MEKFAPRNYVAPVINSPVSYPNKTLLFGIISTFISFS